MADPKLKSSEAAARKAARPRRSAKPRLTANLLGLLAESFPKITRLLKVVRDWSRRKPLWLRVPLYGFVVGAVVVYAFGDALLNVPVVKSIRGGIAEYTDDLFAVPLPKASGKEFAIAMARIEDDQDGGVGKSLSLALKLSGNSWNIYSQVGIVTLVGLITKHGILIVEFANQRQVAGRSKLEAVVEAATLRLRPILMTTGAMVLGAVPLAVATGAGAESREVIGMTIVGGLLVGTLFTLFVIPVVYLLLARRHEPEDTQEPVPVK